MSDKLIGKISENQRIQILTIAEGENQKWLKFIQNRIFILAYDRFHGNVQKSISHHKHKSYIAVAKTGLTRMIVMKIQYFYGYTEILPEPVTH